MIRYLGNKNKKGIAQEFSLNGSMNTLDMDNMLGVNLVQNGRFTNNTTGWTSYQTSNPIQVVNGVVECTASGTLTPYAIFSTDDINTGIYEVGKTYHPFIKVRVTNNDCIMLELKTDVGSDLYYKIDNPIKDKWYMLSTPFLYNDSQATQIRIYHHYLDNTTATGKTMEIQEAMILEGDWTNKNVSYMPYGEVVKGQINVGLYGNSFYNLADNGIDYVNWTIAGAGTTKSANGIHLVQDGVIELAGLSFSVQKSKQYTIFYNVKENNLTGTFVVKGNTGVFPFDNNQILSKNIGINKVLVTTSSTDWSTNAFEFALAGDNIDGEYIDFEVYAILEGDHTNTEINKPLKPFANSTVSVGLTSRVNFFPYEQPINFTDISYSERLKKYPIKLSKGTYYFKFIGSTDGKILSEDTSILANKNESFTLSEDSTVYFYGSDTSPIYEDIMLSTSDIPYVPHSENSNLSVTMPSIRKSVFNYVDKTKVTVGKAVVGSGVLTNLENYNSTEHISITEGTTYSIAGIVNSGINADSKPNNQYIDFYDENKTFINSKIFDCSMVYNFIANQSGYVRFSVSDNDLDTARLIEGEYNPQYDTVDTWVYGENYYDQEIPARSLPNDIKDKVKEVNGEWVKVQKNNEMQIENDKISNFITSNTNYDVIVVEKPNDFIGYNTNDVSIFKTSSLEGFTEISDTSVTDNASYVRKYTMRNSSLNIVIFVEKNKYTDLADVKSKFSTLLTYQLKNELIVKENKGNITIDEILPYGIQEYNGTFDEVNGNTVIKRIADDGLSLLAQEEVYENVDVGFRVEGELMSYGEGTTISVDTLGTYPTLTGIIKASQGNKILKIGTTL